jgi:NADPH-dependent 2,4-dienoyl-CoA reductase/sulfur reductase-like enzyme
MTSAPRSVIVVGAGLAGHATAKALRKLGFDGSITIIGAEKHRPYDRPPLSKEFLLGELDEQHLHLERHDEDLGAKWLLGRRAMSVDPDRRAVALEDGTVVAAEAVVIATGSRARRLPADVADGKIGGLHYLRTLADSRALRADLLPGRSMVVVGAGFIGSEVASAGRRRGLTVTILEAASTPLEAALGSDAGRLVAGLHTRNGVDLRTSATVDVVHGTSRVSAAGLLDGTTLAADVIMVGVGAAPEVEWLDTSGLVTQPGVRADQHGATELPGIYAVGDGSAWWDPVLERHLRIEHWTESKDRPVILAARIMGESLPTVMKPPYFWSDQYGVRIEFAGWRRGDEEFVIESGSLDEGLIASYRRDGQTVAILGIDQRREFARRRRSLIIREAAD